MKKELLIMSLVLAGGSLFAQDFTARQRPVPPTRKAPGIVTHRAVDGAVQKAVRSGNPLQMVNPFAPQEYGDGSECVYNDGEHDSIGNQNRGREGKPKGIRLFAFAW